MSDEREELRRLLRQAAESPDGEELEAVARALSRVGYTHAVNIAGATVVASPGDTLILNVDTISEDLAKQLEERTSVFLEKRGIGVIVVANATRGSLLTTAMNGNGGRARLIDQIAIRPQIPPRPFIRTANPFARASRQLGRVARYFSSTMVTGREIHEQLERAEIETPGIIAAADELSSTTDMSVGEALSYLQSNRMRGPRADSIEIDAHLCSSCGGPAFSCNCHEAIQCRYCDEPDRLACNCHSIIDSNFCADCDEDIAGVAHHRCSQTSEQREASLRFQSHMLNARADALGVEIRRELEQDEAMQEEDEAGTDGLDRYAEHVDFIEECMRCERQANESGMCDDHEQLSK